MRSGQAGMGLTRGGDLDSLAGATRGLKTRGATAGGCATNAPALVLCGAARLASSASLPFSFLSPSFLCDVLC